MSVTTTPRSRVLLFLALAVAAGAAAVSTPLAGQTTTATLFEGARLSTVTAARPWRTPRSWSRAAITAGRPGRSGARRRPARARQPDRQDRHAGDRGHAHAPLPSERRALEDSCTGKAYFGVAAVMSLGQDTGDLPFQVRDESIPGAARLRTAGRGITMPEPGRSDVPYWISTEAEGRKAVQELAAQKVDFVKIWVDDRNGKYKKLTPELYGADHRRGAQERAPRHGAHLHAPRTRRDCCGRPRRLRPRRARPDIDDEFLAMVKERRNLVLVPNLPDRGVKTDFSWLRRACRPRS